jgi:undecaprenyl-diphosphatase
MLAGVQRTRAELFSFVLAVVLTPPVVGREALRLAHSHSEGLANNLVAAMLPSALGTVVAFLAGLLALRWLSRWLESGRWHFFGIYCLVAAAVVATLYSLGY